MDELEYMKNVDTHDSCVIKSIRKYGDKFSSKSRDLVYKIMQTPIICSAADNFIFHF